MDRARRLDGRKWMPAHRSRIPSNEDDLSPPFGERPDYALEQHIDESDFDESDIVDVELKAGEMSIHDVFAIHGSRVNTSNKRRAGFAIRYMPAASLYDRTIKLTGAARGLRQDMSKRPIYLVRGQDRAGNDFACGQDQPFAVGGD